MDSRLPSLLPIPDQTGGRNEVTSTSTWRQGDRGRDRERERDWDRSGRRRSRSGERDQHGRRRERSRSRSRERRRDREDGSYRSRRYEDTWRDDRDRERERERGGRGRWEEWRRSDDRRDEDHSGVNVDPGPVVMLRNLRDVVRKEDISRELEAHMSYVKDVRLIQKRDGSHNFAFVEFYETRDATKWMEANKDTFELQGSRVNVEYSRHRRIQGDYRERSHHDDRDWICFKCRTLNFSRRKVCMTCDCPRTESDSLHEDVRQGKISGDKKEGERDEKNPPSNVLILKGLDTLTTESSVRAAITAICTAQLRDVRLIRDKATNTSRGFCFVELNTTEEAQKLLDKLQNQYPAFFVDGRRVSVNFARQSNPPLASTVQSNVASAAIAQAQWSMAAQTQQQNVQWQKQQTQQQGSYQTPQAQQGGWQQQQQSDKNAQQAYHQGGTSTHAQPTQQEQSTQQQYSSTTQSQQQTTTQQAGAVDSSQQQLSSTYVYDSTSGFYYDSATGLYYDPKTQYHYNSQTGHYCYYDPGQQAYVPVASDGTPITSTSTVTPTTTAAPTQEKRRKDSTATVSAGSTTSAKKIAKDMERWAKNVNAAKAAQQQQLQVLIQLERTEAQIKAAIGAPASFLPTSGTEEILGERQVLLPTAGTEVMRSGIALSAALEQEDRVDRSSLSAHAAEVGDLPGQPPSISLPPGADPNPAHTNWSQLACLLCKRKFPSKEVLIKHQQISDLHKQNLEIERKAQFTAIGSQQESEIKYRDRAKERREKYGTPDAIVPGWKKRLERELAKGPPVPYEQPTREGIGGDNIGSKMLQAMGWNEGQGLGRSNQGITQPIQAQMRQAGAGLGAPGSNYGLYNSGGGYKETLKQLTRARFGEVFKQ